METAPRPSDRPREADTSMHVKREPAEESRLARAMDVALLQNPMAASRPSQGLQGIVRTLDFNGYGNYDQRLVNPAVGRIPDQQQVYSQSLQQSNSELERAEKLKKELSNYMHPLQQSTTIPSALIAQQLNSNTHIPMNESDNASNSSQDLNANGLLKRSNGKLAMPEMLNTTGLNPMDLVSSLNTHQRAKREFVPDERKDEGYWNKRSKNNDSARRSRVKRKTLEKIMEKRLMDLQQENIELRHELNALKRRYGEEVPVTKPSCMDYYKNTVQPALNGKLVIKEDDMDQQSSASEDSRSLDDSRSGFIRSSSALSQSLEHSSHRDRTDSFGSSSCGSANRSPNSNSPPYNHSYVRTDKSGALDLTNDNISSCSARVPLPTTTHTFTHNTHTTTATTTNGRDYPSVVNSIPAANESSDNNNVQFSEKMDTAMRGFPLKCRWKLSSSSNSNTTPCTKNNGDTTTTSFPGA